MNAHERALELGATAFDFRLAPAERVVLERHLAECLDCRTELNGLTEDARRIAARPVAHMSPEAAAAVRAVLERSRRTPSLSMLLAAAALLLLAAIAAAAVGSQLVERLDRSRLAVEPAPTAQPSPALTPGVPETWTMSSLGRTPGIPFQAVAVAGSDLGRLAIGERRCDQTGEELYDCAAVVARSDDGRAWTLAGTLPYATAYVPVTSGPEPGIIDLAAGPDGYVAVGFARDGAAQVMGIGDGAAWWSADGLTWERTLLEDGARPSTAFRAPGRWLVGGVVYRGFDIRGDRPIGAIWASTDGRTWTRIEDEAVFDVGGYFDTGEDPSAGGIGSFAWNGSVLIAGGAVYTDDGLPSTAAVWSSTDGVTWERAGSLPAGDAVERLAAVDGGFVAAVRRCPVSGDCTTVVLHSADGRAWQPVTGELRSFAAMAAAGDAVILVTGEYGTLDVHASVDGASWVTLGSVAAPERVDWAGPTLVPRPDGSIDLLIRVDPLDPQESEADAYTLTWQIAPAS